MNTFDVALLALACVFVVIGMLKGLVRILIGLAALVAAFALAARYHQPLADRLSGLEIPSWLLMLGTYGGIFLGVMLAGGLLAWAARKLIKAALLSWADRLGGAAVGLVSAVVLSALLVLPVVAYSPWSERLLRGSVLAPYVTAVTDLTRPLVPDGLSERYEQRMKGLRQLWRDQWFDRASRASEV
jgi:membrane protein required for colicin V production